jgi:hypothetical protein
MATQNPLPDNRNCQKAYQEFLELRLTSSQVAYLCAYIENCGRVFAAGRAAGLSAAAHYKWLKTDEKYVSAFALAKQLAADNLLDQATRRAVQGCDQIQYYKGIPIGIKTEYSDTLMALLLKGAFPEQFRERVETKIGNLSNEVLKLDPGREKLTDERLTELIALADSLKAKLKTPEPPQETK